MARRAFPERHEMAIRVLQHLNAAAGRTFEPVATNLDPIAKRLEEVKDDETGILEMVNRQVLLWKTDDRMAPYLRPATLFNRTKFRQYYDDRRQPIPTKSNANGRPHRNDFIGTPESRAAWEQQCAARIERDVEGF